MLVGVPKEIKVHESRVALLDTNLARSSFIDHLRIERGLSENSLTSYGRDLRYFLDFLQYILSLELYFYYLIYIFHFLYYKYLNNVK